MRLPNVSYFVDYLVAEVSRVCSDEEASARPFGWQHMDHPSAMLPSWRTQNRESCSGKAVGATCDNLAVLEADKLWVSFCFTAAPEVRGTCPTPRALRLQVRHLSGGL